MEQIITINEIEYHIVKGVKVRTHMDAVYEIEENGRTYFKVCRWVDIMDKKVVEVYYIKDVVNTKSMGI